MKSEPDLAEHVKQVEKEGAARGHSKGALGIEGAFVALGGGRCYHNEMWILKFVPGILGLVNGWDQMNLTDKVGEWFNISSW